MNGMKKTLALLLALLLLCGAALADQIAPEQVLLRVGDKEYTALDIDNVAYQLYSAGQTESYPDYDLAVEAIKYDAFSHQMVRDGSFDSRFTDEELSEMQAEVQKQYDEYLDTYVSYYLSEDTDEARAALRGQAAQFFTENGITQEALLDELKYGRALDLAHAALIADYVPGEEEIGAAFEELAARYEEVFKDDIFSYELYTMQYGENAFYEPAGYRGVLHILLSVDEELMNAYIDAQNKLEEAMTAEPADEAAVAAAQQARDEAEAAVLASREKEISDIREQMAQSGDSVEARESRFLELISLYNTDTGMENETLRKTGYLVHRNSVRYDQNFTSGAFQEKMEKPGDISDPVISQFGIHILYYLRAESEGGKKQFSDLNETVRQDLYDALVSREMNLRLQNAYDAWLQSADVEAQTDLIAQLAEEAAKTLEEAQQGGQQ